MRPPVRPPRRRLRPSPRYAELLGDNAFYQSLAAPISAAEGAGKRLAGAEGRRSKAVERRWRALSCWRGTTTPSCCCTSSCRSVKGEMLEGRCGAGRAREALGGSSRALAMLQGRSLALSSCTWEATVEVTWRTRSRSPLCHLPPPRRLEHACPCCRDLQAALHMLLRPALCGRTARGLTPNLSTSSSPPRAIALRFRLAALRHATMLRTWRASSPACTVQ
ncbi:hypothetical protein AAT19DRAFT_14696 [Rhodotorula toruloides]|uniref:Uncharacterized protein n=1 Tax=Rhodotorula toruloides TaxID=5286 RepID=A0A2T0A8L3_RHOTO|nr:hypothetical protein AAT19DRAFT_14696 [Rhodotorula toruloides]